MAEASPTPIVETAPEEWRPIPGYEGDYEVSNHGRVRRLVFNNRYGRKPLAEPLIIKLYRDRRTRYMQIRLFRDGKKTFHGSAHTLVALAFIGEKPSPLHQVAHLDGDRTNNVLSNLAYVTAKENAAHKRVHGSDVKVEGPDAGGAKLSADQVREMRGLRQRFGAKLPFWMLGNLFDVSMWTAQEVCARVTYRNVA
jgi:hypothetical protein